MNVQYMYMCMLCMCSVCACVCARTHGCMFVHSLSLSVDWNQPNLSIYIGKVLFVSDAVIMSLHTQGILWLLGKYLCLHIMLFFQLVEEVEEHLAGWNIFLRNCLPFPEHCLSHPVSQI
jgi:hypothetical protein